MSRIPPAHLTPGCSADLAVLLLGDYLVLERIQREKVDDSTHIYNILQFGNSAPCWAAKGHHPVMGWKQRGERGLNCCHEDLAGRTRETPSHPPSHQEQWHVPRVNLNPFLPLPDVLKYLQSE